MYIYITYQKTIYVYLYYLSNNYHCFMALFSSEGKHKFDVCDLVIANLVITITSLYDLTIKLFNWLPSPTLMIICGHSLISRNGGAGWDVDILHCARCKAVKIGSQICNLPAICTPLYPVGDMGRNAIHHHTLRRHS